MKIKIFTPYEWVLVLGVLLSNVIYSCLTGDLDLIGMIASVSGLLCVVLVAKGNIWNYLFGLVNVSLYAYISFHATAYGDAALNALYYVPMQFIGYFAWKKRGTRDEQVKARRLSARNRVLVAGLCAAGIFAGYLLLRHYGGGQPWKDSATTVLSIVAQALMAMAYMEQWVLWILTNVISVVMWTSFALKGTPHAAVMVMMWAFYLLNSINGLREWMRLSRGDVSKED